MTRMALLHETDVIVYIRTLIGQHKVDRTKETTFLVHSVELGLWQKDFVNNTQQLAHFMDLPSLKLHEPQT